MQKELTDALCTCFYNTNYTPDTIYEKINNGPDKYSHKVHYAHKCKEQMKICIQDYTITGFCFSF